MGFIITGKLYSFSPLPMINVNTNSMDNQYISLQFDDSRNITSILDKSTGYNCLTKGHEAIIINDLDHNYNISLKDNKILISNVKTLKTRFSKCHGKSNQLLIQQSPSISNNNERQYNFMHHSEPIIKKIVNISKSDIAHYNTRTYPVKIGDMVMHDHQDTAFIYMPIGSRINKVKREFFKNYVFDTLILDQVSDVEIIVGTKTNAFFKMNKMKSIINWGIWPLSYISQGLSYIFNMIMKAIPNILGLLLYIFISILFCAVFIIQEAKHQLQEQWINTQISRIEHSEISHEEKQKAINILKYKNIKSPSSGFNNMIILIVRICNWRYVFNNNLHIVSHITLFGQSIIGYDCAYVWIFSLIGMCTSILFTVGYFIFKDNHDMVSISTYILLLMIFGNNVTMLTIVYFLFESLIENILQTITYKYLI